MPRLNLPPYRPTSYQESYEHPVDVPQDYIPHKTWVRTEGELLQPRSLQSGKYRNKENTLSIVTIPGSWLALITSLQSFPSVSQKWTMHHFTVYYEPT